MSWSRCYPQSRGEVAVPQICKPLLEDLELQAHNFLCSLLNVRAQVLPQHRGFLMVYVTWMACSPPVGDLELVEDQLTIVLGLSLYITAMSWQSLPTCFLRSRCMVCEPTGLRQEECLLGRTECDAEPSGITPTQGWMCGDGLLSNGRVLYRHQGKGKLSSAAKCSSEFGKVVLVPMDTCSFLELTFS